MKFAKTTGNNVFVLAKIVGDHTSSVHPESFVLTLPKEFIVALIQTDESETEETIRQVKLAGIDKTLAFSVK